MRVITKLALFGGVFEVTSRAWWLPDHNQAEAHGMGQGKRDAELMKGIRVAFGRSTHRDKRGNDVRSQSSGQHAAHPRQNVYFFHTGSNGKAGITQTSSTPMRDANLRKNCFPVRHQIAGETSLPGSDGSDTTFAIL